MAIEIKRGLPLPVMQVIGADSWAGGPLIQLENDYTRPGANEVAMNYCWLKPVVSQFRASVPSGYYCADVMLALDELFFGKLLVPTIEGQTKKVLAAQEGSRLKALVGGLRYLWRSSASALFI